MHICDWSNFDTECAHLISSVRNGKANTSHLLFSEFLHPLTTNSNAPSCGSQKNILHLKSLFGEVSAIDTTEFVSLMSPLTFMNIQCHISWLECLSAMTNRVLMSQQYHSDLTIIQKCGND